MDSFCYLRRVKIFGDWISSSGFFLILKFLGFLSLKLILCCSLKVFLFFFFIKSVFTFFVNFSFSKSLNHISAMIKTIKIAPM